MLLTKSEDKIPQKNNNRDDDLDQTLSEPVLIKYGSGDYEPRKRSCHLLRPP